MNNGEPRAIQNQPQLFPLGQIVATPGALEALESSFQTPAEFLTRHASGDWGDAEHKRDSENTAPERAANWRATAWEIHPVTSIELVTKPR
jgi:hypothetical protein